MKYKVAATGEEVHVGDTIIFKNCCVPTIGTIRGELSLKLTPVKFKDLFKAGVIVKKEEFTEEDLDTMNEGFVKLMESRIGSCDPVIKLGLYGAKIATKTHPITAVFRYCEIMADILNINRKPSSIGYWLDPLMQFVPSTISIEKHRYIVPIFYDKEDASAVYYLLRPFIQLLKDNGKIEEVCGE